MGFIGSVAVHRWSDFKAIDRRMIMTELLLRCVIVGLCVLTSLLIGTDSQVKEIFSFQRKASFTDMKSLGLLVFANGFEAVYSLIQVLRCVICMVRGNIVFSKPLAWAIFSCDQVITYLTISALAIATQSSMFAKFGQSEFQWMKICDIYGKFCNQVADGIGTAFIASVCMVFISGMSAFGVFRLYGGNKCKC
ncbi:CASP-like protein 2B1 [Impatiens glandulifera]|uniref:CASP-like protein 2B1 n=1 Tax=Impatiens glandulifera TaxID=253017 RepID=UPI001FB0F14F|nr:CASP-like protein 2B1 [Impatiens glandulifera]